MRHHTAKRKVTLGTALSLFSVAVVCTNTTDTTDNSPQQPVKVNQTTSSAGNPFVDGWYADPDTAICKCEVHRATT